MSTYQQLLAKQRAFFTTGKTKSIEFRIEQLTKLRQVVIEKHEAIEASLYKDLRKSEFEAFATEVTAMIDEINCAVGNLESWVKPVDVESPPIFGQAQSRIYYEPYGTVLILNTWNYPFVLCFKPLVGALAAGNCCIVKPSEVAPATSKVLADIINTAFDEEYCVAIECGVEETTKLLEERFDFILYTGSTNVGKIVAQAAARYLTPTVLELGGKNPCIIDETADIERSVPTICWGRFINSGQTCTAPDYIVVHKDKKDELIEALKKQIKAFYGDNIQSSPDFGRVINERHVERLQGLLTEGTIVFGGETDKADHYVSPTIIDGITWDSKIMQEEIFGPIIPIITYENLSDVIEKLKGREKSLALYIYSTNEATQQQLINEVSFGGGCINATLMHMLNTNLPFGGVGYSGHGSYAGRWSIETFSHKKGILNRALTDEPSPLFPPYEDHVKGLKGFYLG
ncbi:MAG: aldehyde dehydrogenase [Tannerella sp.]|jgi:acyl-CoA reductase-like NAD-dependent aldehyde dehydrogenase|nr:aldehyde dehydrogenase [Tannerella sp.]